MALLYPTDRPTCCCPFAADLQSVTHMCVVGGPTKIKGRVVDCCARMQAVVKLGGVLVGGVGTVGSLRAGITQPV